MLFKVRPNRKRWPHPHHQVVMEKHVKKCIEHMYIRRIIVYWVMIECRICCNKSQHSQATLDSQFTKASKGPPACLDIENDDLSSTSRMHRADFTNPDSWSCTLMKGGRSSFSMSGLVTYRPTDTTVALAASGLEGFAANVFRAGKWIYSTCMVERLHTLTNLCFWLSRAILIP